MAKNDEFDLFAITPEMERYASLCEEHSTIDTSLYEKYDVKRGLRDINGKGVLTGLTEISDIQSSKVVDGKTVPCDGKLFYRGYDIEEIVAGFIKEKRFGFEETIYLLLWESFLSLVLHTNIMEMGAAGIGAGIAARICILLLAEPVLLARLGTTPGKFLMGLRAAAENGARLTWREAFYRTWTVLKKGSGFYIPVYCLVREYLSYRE